MIDIKWAFHKLNTKDHSNNYFLILSPSHILYIDKIRYLYMQHSRYRNIENTKRFWILFLHHIINNQFMLYIWHKNLNIFHTI